MSETEKPVLNTDLKKQYPVSLWIIVRRNLGSIVTLFFVAIALTLSRLFLADISTSWIDKFIDFLMLKKTLIIIVVSSLVFARMFYGYLFWLNYKYFLSDGRLYIETGVINHKEASVPITFLSEFYLERNFMDYLFGMKNLIIKTTFGEGHEVARIEALKSKHAESLREFLIKQGSLNSHKTTI